jgi:hypothetical protein
MRTNARGKITEITFPYHLIMDRRSKIQKTKEKEIHFVRIV